MLLASYPESHTPKDHPIRRIKHMVDAVPAEISAVLDKVYSTCNNRRLRPGGCSNSRCCWHSILRSALAMPAKRLSGDGRVTLRDSNCYNAYDFVAAVVHPKSSWMLRRA